MESLKELIRIITRDRVKNIEIIGNSSSNKNKLNEFYGGIQNGHFSNDNEAASYFYGPNSTESAGYKKLKKRLQRRLIDTIFFIDVNRTSYNEIQQAYYTSYKDWAAVKILLGRAARKTAIPIAERIIKNAIKFEFSDLVLDISRILRTHYGAIEGNQKKYNRYNDYVKQYLEILNAELIAEEHYQTLVRSYNNTKLDYSKVEVLAIQYTEELKRYSKYLQSYRLNLYSFLVFAMRHQIVNDYKNMILECEKAVHYFESKKFQPSKSALYNFLYKILACYIQLKEFKKGEKTVNRCLKLLLEGEANWFNTLEQYLLLSFHTNNLNQAYEIFCQATEHKNFNRLYEDATENWRAYEAYLYFFISIGAIQIQSDEKLKLKKFSLTRFLNDMPVHSKDKRRKNIPILIIHVLFLLQKRQYEKVIDRVESLNQYCYRYLRKDDTFRSNCFIKMLLQLPKANFHREAVVRKADKFYKKLIQNPSNMVVQASEIEIMPYEMLWEYVLNSLDNKVRYKK